MWTMRETMRDNNNNNDNILTILAYVRQLFTRTTIICTRINASSPPCCCFSLPILEPVTHKTLSLRVQLTKTSVIY